MIRDTAVSIIQDRLGNRTGLESKIIAEMQLAQASLEGSEFLPWFLLNLDTSLTAGASLSLPTGFLREVDEFGLWLVKATGGKTKLIKDDYDNLEQSVTDSEIAAMADDPTHYALLGDKIYFFPSPTRAGSLRFAYYKADAVLSSNIENLWMKYAPALLVAKTGIAVARFLRDIEALKLFGSDYGEEMTKLQNASIAREQAARAAFVGAA